MAAEDLADAKPPGTLRLCVRAVFLCWAFLPATLTFWLAFFVGPFRRRLWYPLLTWCLGRAGACFVKWAQWSATRSDLFPVALCNSLAGLQAGAPKTFEEAHETTGRGRRRMFDRRLLRLL